MRRLALLLLFAICFRLCKGQYANVTADATTPVPLPNCTIRDGPPIAPVGQCSDGCPNLCNTQCTPVCVINDTTCLTCIQQCLFTCTSSCDECEHNSTGLLLTSQSGTPLFDPCAGLGTQVGQQPPLFCDFVWDFRIGYYNDTPGSVSTFVKGWYLTFVQSGVTLLVPDPIFECDAKSVAHAVRLTLRNTNSTLFLQWVYQSGGTNLDCQTLLRNFSSPFDLPGWNQYTRVDLNVMFNFTDGGGQRFYENSDTFGVCGQNNSIECIQNANCAGGGNFCFLKPIYLDQQCVCSAAVSITPAPTHSNTNTPTSSATRTPTPTRTNTQTPSGTQTSTPTPTASLTHGATPSLTPTLTPTFTPTLTPTHTPSLTPSLTPTLTHTPSLTSSFTPTVTTTRTPSLTPSVSPTSSNTPTQSATKTPSGSNTRSQTPSTSFSSSPSSCPSPSPTKLKRGPVWPWIFLPIGVAVLMGLASLLFLLHRTFDVHGHFHHGRLDLRADYDERLIWTSDEQL